jgi:hypothetical protein
MKVDHLRFHTLYGQSIDLRNTTSIMIEKGLEMSKWPLVSLGPPLDGHGGRSNTRITITTEKT